MRYDGSFRQRTHFLFLKKYWQIVTLVQRTAVNRAFTWGRSLSDESAPLSSVPMSLLSESTSSLTSAPFELQSESAGSADATVLSSMAWRCALALTVALVLEVALIFHAKRARLQRLQASDALSCASSCETGPQKMILSKYNYQIMNAYSVWCPRTKVVTECFLFFPPADALRIR